MMSSPDRTDSSLHHPSLIEDLARSLDAVGALVDQIRPDQWSAPTPCPDWTVRVLVEHLIGMNRVFVAMFTGQELPQRPAAGRDEPDPVGAYRDTAAALLVAVRAPGVLDRELSGPLGSASGADRVRIRLYDLLAHGWDLARATGQRVALPDDVAEHSLAFAQTQLRDAARPGRFDPPRTVDERSPAIERLVAFLGRSVDTAAAADAGDARLGGERLRCGIVLRVREDACEIAADGQHRWVGYARQFPSPRIERVSPGHLVALTTAPDGTDVVVWRWYDAVVIEEKDELVVLWEPAHGEVSAQRRSSYVSSPPGTRAYASAGLPGAEWWVAGLTVEVAANARVELDEVEDLYTEYDLWDVLV